MEGIEMELEVITDQPDTLQTSYSALTLHRKCPQAWTYRYTYGLSKDESESSAPERDFGSWWSALRAAESLERGRALGSLRGPESKFRAVEGVEKFRTESVTVEEVFAAADQWWADQDEDTKANWEERLGEGLPKRLRYVFEEWLVEWREERKNEEPIAVEMFWKRQLPNPPGDADWNLNAGKYVVNIVGFVDEVYYDRARDMVVIRDHKTGKDLSQNSALSDLMDSQLALYGWGAAPTLRSWGVRPVRAMGFDRSRSKKPPQPAVTATGTLAKSSTMYDLRTYLEFCAGPDGDGAVWGKPDEYFVTGTKKGQPKFGRYLSDPKEIERLSTKAHREVYFQRTLVPLSKHTQRAHLRAAVDTATDIWSTTQRSARTGEAPRNMGKAACQFCDFANLCRAQMMGGPSGEYEVSAFGLTAKDGRIFVGMPKVGA